MHVCYHNKEYLEDPDRTSNDAAKEIQKGLHLINGIDKPLVGVFGSHSVGADDPQYQACQRMAGLLGANGYGVITGGGPGIMEAANRGAKESGMPSIGVKAALLEAEQVADDVHTDVLSCTFMFVRRFILSINAHALVFYPGGYGTLNELFEYVVLIQTGMLEDVPVICVDREFWSGMRSWVSSDLIDKALIKQKDLDIIQFVDTPEEVLRIVEQSKH